MVRLHLQPQDVLDALRMHLRGARDLEKVHAHTGRIQADRLQHRLLNHQAEPARRQLAAVHIRHVRPQHQAGLLAAPDFLEVPRLADSELDGVGTRIHKGAHHLAHVLNALEKAGLVEKAVVDGHVEASAGADVEQSLESVGFHRFRGRESGRITSRRADA